jgi:hypothetical protein
MSAAGAQIWRKWSRRFSGGRNAGLTMKDQAAPFRPVHLTQQSLHSICTILGGDEAAVDEHKPLAAADRLVKFPARPEPHILSESIPFFFIARNRVGLWIAREAEGRTGGAFLFKKSALLFAEKNSCTRGCATMFLAERLELDVENRGNRLIAWIGALRKVVARYVPDHPPPVPLLERQHKPEWLWPAKQAGTRQAEFMNWQTGRAARRLRI